jgi:hypothetical protein
VLAISGVLLILVLAFAVIRPRGLLYVPGADDLVQDAAGDPRR